MTHNDLLRFQQAQDNGAPSIYDSAIAELAMGRKTGHWIWFVLPQRAGLGHSEMAQRYGIAGLAEAPVVGLNRLAGGDETPLCLRQHRK